MSKLNELVKTNNVNAVFGFKAFADYAHKYKNNNAENSIIISTLSPAVMHKMGFDRYISPVLPRGTVFHTAEEIYDSDLDATIVTVYPSEENGDRQIIVSRHTGTIELLKGMYPNAEIMTGNITPDDIKGSFVIGTLPPMLIQYADSYKSVTITDFDYAKDGDLNGDELKQRLHICDPIRITVE